MNRLKNIQYIQEIILIKDKNMLSNKSYYNRSHVIQNMGATITHTKVTLF